MPIMTGNEPAALGGAPSEGPALIIAIAHKPDNDKPAHMTDKRKPAHKR